MSYKSIDSDLTDPTKVEDVSIGGDNNIPIIVEENEELHLIRTCDGDSGFDSPNEHDLK